MQTRLCTRVGSMRESLLFTLLAPLGALAAPPAGQKTSHRKGRVFDPRGAQVSL
jgi:hypothetical protein